ncbi:MAG: hypothetical protein ACM3ZO_12105 [Clostridia bacterium]
MLPQDWGERGSMGLGRLKVSERKEHPGEQGRRRIRQSANEAAVMAGRYRHIRR